MVAETITLPTDVVKTRLQVSISTDLQYNGMLHCGFRTFQLEGIQGLFKGLNLALMRQIGYTGLAFVLFEPIKDSIINTLTYFSNNNSLNIKNNFGTRVLSGGTAGAIGITVFNPTEVLKTQVQTNLTKIRIPISLIIKNIYKNEGILGFWSGVRPNISRAFLVNAAEIGSYDHFKNELLNNNIIKSDGLLLRITSSFGAGIVSTIVSTPVDVVKTNQMNEAGRQSLIKSKSMFKRIFYIWKNNGIMDLYKGWQPILIRKVLWCTCFFITYDSIRDYIGLPTTDK
jgi:hypothetical protein